MSRSYRAARRRSQKAPVPFDLVVEIEKTKRDDNGDVQEVYLEDETHAFLCKGEVSTLLLSELAYNADLDVADPEAMKLVRSFFSNAFGPGEEQRKAYYRFFRLITEHGDDELLMEIMAGLVEDFMGRPTQQPSPSQLGPSTTGGESKVVSLSAGTVQVVPGEVLQTEYDNEHPEELEEEPPPAAASSS